MNATWTANPRSETANVGPFICDVWRCCDKVGPCARYTVLNSATGRYVAGGRCADMDWAKQVSTGFAQSLLDVAQAEGGA